MDILPLGINKEPRELLKDLAPGLVLGIAFIIFRFLQPATVTSLFTTWLPLQFLGNFVIAVIAAPVLEEWLFRGAIDSFFEEKVGNVYAAVILTAIFFAIFHWAAYGQFLFGNFATFATAFMFSIAFSMIARYTKSLSGSILAHAMVNLALLAGTVFVVTGI